MKFLKALKHSIFGAEKNNDLSLYELLKKNFVHADGSFRYVSELLYLAQQRYGNDELLIENERILGFKELYFRAAAFAKLLQTHGVKPGDRVIIFSENSIFFYVAYFAIWHVGAVAIPLNVFLHEKELAYIIEDSRPQIISSSSKKIDKLSALIAAPRLLDDIPFILTEADIDMSTPLAQLEHDYRESKPHVRGIDELVLLLYTSGTTGKPKGVMLSSRNVMINALQAYARMGTVGLQRERFFSVLPLFHVFAQNACVWLPVMTGSSIIIVEGVERKLILQGLSYKPTLFFGVPALYGLLCMMKDAPLETVKLFASGADAMPDKIRATFALLYGRKICSGYGLTEASPVVAVNQDNDELPTNVVGRAVAHLQCQVRNDAGDVLSDGSIGTLWIKGGNVMMGYYGAPLITAEVLQDGWLNTGDFARIDKKGRITICGRSKDLIIHKGFNIYPQEIENILMQHPIVFKAAIIGKQESEAGEIPIAYVAVKERSLDIENILRSFCRQNLAPYKIPRKFICLEDLPMNATGKVDKKKLHTFIQQ